MYTSFSRTNNDLFSILVLKWHDFKLKNIRSLISCCSFFVCYPYQFSIVNTSLQRLVQSHILMACVDCKGLHMICSQDNN